jgi:hypothetical protein
MIVDLIQNVYHFNVVIDNKEIKQIMILKPHVINNLHDKFIDKILEERTYMTPVTQSFRII